MGSYIAGEVIKLMIKKGIQVTGSKIAVMGITFKENCPDVRNTKVIDIIRHLQSYNIQVDIHDPWADPHEVEEEYGVSTTKELPGGTYDAVILAVAHNQFRYEDIKKLRAKTSVLFDVKSVLDKELVDARL